MGILLHPYSIIAIAFLLYSGWLFQQGRHFEQWRESARVEATNAKVRSVNQRETEVTTKEEELRQKALVDARPVIAAAGKCLASPELASALSRIR